MSSYTISTNMNQKANTNLKVVNLSFKTAENKKFLEMISLLRPGYNPPNRKKVTRRAPR